MENLVVLDCEVYPNYFLVAFKNLDKGSEVTIESKGVQGRLSKEQVAKLTAIMRSRHTFGFNSRNYDMPIILYALTGATCENIHKMSDYIIDNGSQGWMTLNAFNLVAPKAFKHFDIQEPSPGVMVRLKLYGGRMHSKRLQDLPIEPGTMLTPTDMENIKPYCINDLDTAIDLYREVEDRIKLREIMSAKYGKDLMSKSDAQIAETVIKSEIQKLEPNRKLYAPKIPSSITFKYDVPEYISFKSQQLNQALDIIRNHDFELDGKGSIKLPAELSRMKIVIGKSKYQLGIGGLHSTEKKQTVVPNDDQMLVDRDVAAYYPNIILNLKLFPKHLGECFLKVYRAIVDERIAAKKAGNKVVNESLKIVINGSFGKLGNKYSALYSPDLMMTVTLTGQLSLLMLIEALEDEGIHVVSANTDGIVSLMRKDQYNTYDIRCFEWEMMTNFDLEETRYKALYSRDVNNYIAMTEYGEKGKGVFTSPSIGKNPSTPICVTAVKKFLMQGVSIEETIRKCEDITQFLSVRTVNGGAIWRDKYLGRVVRWIYSTDGDIISYKKANKTGNHNKVAKSDGARPIMELGGLPTDIDYERYMSESSLILESLGLTV